MGWEAHRSRILSLRLPQCCRTHAVRTGIHAKRCTGTPHLEVFTKDKPRNSGACLSACDQLRPAAREAQTSKAEAEKRNRGGLRYACARDIRSESQCVVKGQVQVVAAGRCKEAAVEGRRQESTRICILDWTYRGQEVVADQCRITQAEPIVEEIVVEVDVVTSGRAIRIGY